MDCLTSPIWKDVPGEYNWSPKLFDGSDRFLIQPELKSKIQSFSDLKGLSLGIYNGYVYHPELMELIRSDELNAVKVNGLEHGIQLLKLKRLDPLIDFDILLEYQIRELGLHDTLSLANFPADEYALHCAYSKKMKVSAEAMNLVVLDLIQSGKVEDILKRYR